MTNIKAMISQYTKIGYGELLAESKVCQDIILKAISKSVCSKNVTIKGGVVINCTAGVAIICLTIGIAHKLFNNWMIDLFVGLTTATHPFLIEMSCSFLRENLFLLFSVITFYFLIDYYKNYRIKNLFLISVFSVTWKYLTSSLLFGLPKLK